MRYNRTYQSCLLFVIIAFNACGPVNRFTKLEKTPQAYSMNYCASDIKAPKSILNKAAWVVYSDRENNVSYRKPGSRHKQNEIGFLEPFLVIGQKGDFLQIIKYDPEITKDDQLTDHKAAEYYGWIHKSRLILSPKGSTNLTNNLANKQIIALTDTNTLQKPANYFTGDSVKLFKDPHLRIEHALVGLHEVVYLLKYSDDNKRVLIARKSELTPDEAGIDILGWVSRPLIQSIGQQLFWDMSAVLRNGYREDLTIVQPPAIKYNPVYSRSTVDDKKVIETGMFTPVVDKSDNYVFNVNGKAITYNQSKQIEANLKRLNIVFVIEAGAVTFDQFPTLVNAVQNMQTTFEDKESGFFYQFGSVLSMTENDSVPVTHSAPLHPDFSRVLETLIDRSAKIEGYSPLSNEHAWKGLEAAIHLVDEQTEATNIILLLGETGNHLEWPNAEIKQRLSDNNCRLLGLQLYSGSDNYYNNFVLQIAQIIEGYADAIADEKKSTILFPNQLRDENAFREEGKNAYMLDFPDRSMTQGGIVFPEKEERLALEVITSSIDSFLVQIKQDNISLINNLHAAFNTFGSHRDKYDSLLVKKFHFYPETNNLHEFKEHFEALPGWFLTGKIDVSDTLGVDSIPYKNWNFSSEYPSDTTRNIFLRESENTQRSPVKTTLTDLEYHLLVSGVEFDNLISFMEKLTAFKVEKKEKLPLFFRAKKSKNAVPTDCNCSEGFITNRGNGEEEDKEPEWKYRSTKKIRKDIQELLLTELQENSYFQKKNRELKHYTLKQALNTITNSPNVLDTTNPVTIKNLSKKKKISDARLELLLEYFNVKKNDIENSISDKNKFISLEQEYFWINSIHLP
ncbi:MAG: hypothetical protein LC643_00455 [Bacteroidales bacterium]|nr:hypothetical protein [Bacteroidales bacterium]